MYSEYTLYQFIHSLETIDVGVATTALILYETLPMPRFCGYRSGLVMSKGFKFSHCKE